MRKMLKTHRNTIGNLMITLLFVGGCVFLLTGSWDASETEAATGCCGGGAALTSFAPNSGGDFGSDIPIDAKAGGCCGGEGKVILSSSRDDGDGDGDESCKCLTDGTSDTYACDEDVCDEENDCDNETVSSCNTDTGACCEGKTGDCGCVAVCKRDGSPSTMCDAKAYHCWD